MAPRPAIAILAKSLLVFLVIGALPAIAEDIRGQKTIPVIGDAFSFQSGAWASYQVEDRIRNEHYQLWIATLQQKATKAGPAWWLETRVVPTAGEAVATRVLVPETPAGPGDALQAVVQVEGKTPFTIPRKYLRSQKSEVTSFRPAISVEIGAEHVVRFGDRELAVVDVTASDAEGHKVSASTSRNVPPLGLVMADTGDVCMKLEDWGTGAVTRIEGEPVSLFWWILTEAFGRPDPEN